MLDSNSSKQEISQRDDESHPQRKGLRRRGEDKEGASEIGDLEGAKESKGGLQGGIGDEVDATELDSLLPKPTVPTVLELMSPSRRNEGLYPGEGPMITQLLLRSEPVDTPISTIVSSGVYLSRLTSSKFFHLPQINTTSGEGGFGAILRSYPSPTLEFRTIYLRTSRGSHAIYSLGCNRETLLSRFATKSILRR